jgi:hypothetical protein
MVVSPSVLTGWNFLPRYFSVDTARGSLRVISGKLMLTGLVKLITRPNAVAACFMLEASMPTIEFNFGTEIL